MAKIFTGKEIRDYRHQNDLSQEGLARRLGVCTRSVWLWETKGRIPGRVARRALQLEMEDPISCTPALPPAITNQDLIVELVAKYRAVPGTAEARGDYPMIGRLYNQYGYDQVLLAIERLGDKLATDEIREPLAYLAGILARGGVRAGGEKPITRGQVGIQRWILGHYGGDKENE